MNPKFKKLAIAAGVSSAMTMMSMPSHAVLQGAAGEALLVPLVVWADSTGDSTYDANTIIQVSIPGSIGFDDVPNIYVAPNTTPTNPSDTGEVGPSLFPNDADLRPAGSAETSRIHWYWFDKESVHRADESVPVTANDVVTLDWEELDVRDQFEGEIGYMVIGTEIAARGEAANFAMFGDAWLILEDIRASIPVLPMTDGADGMYGTDDDGNLNVGPNDNVVYQSSHPYRVSPLLSGIRTNRSDGLPDRTIFDLPLYSRTEPAMHVIWLDENLGVENRQGEYSYPVAVNVYDSEEIQCSTSVELPYELNVVWIDAYDNDARNDETYFAEYQDPLCLASSSETDSAGFASYSLPEYIDTDADRPESAGVAFTLHMFYTSNTLESITMALGHERGTYTR